MSAIQDKEPSKRLITIHHSRFKAEQHLELLAAHGTPDAWIELGPQGFGVFAMLRVWREVAR